MHRDSPHAPQVAVERDSSRSQRHLQNRGKGKNERVPIPGFGFPTAFTGPFNHSWLQFTNHTLVHSIMVFIQLLGNGFQRVHELSLSQPPASVPLRAKVILRPTVSRQGAHHHILYLLASSCRAPSLMGKRGCGLQCTNSLARVAQETYQYFTVSYQTPPTWRARQPNYDRLVLITQTWHGPHRKHCFRLLLCRHVSVCCDRQVVTTGSLHSNGSFTEPFPTNGRLFCLRNSEFQQTCHKPHCCYVSLLYFHIKRS
jgi:hypothetical protein